MRITKVIGSALALMFFFTIQVEARTIKCKKGYRIKTTGQEKCQKPPCKLQVRCEKIGVKKKPTPKPKKACPKGTQLKWVQVQCFRAPCPPISKCVPVKKNKGCGCITLWAPVCGVDGKTYGNTCKAGCKNVAIKHKGACKAKAVKRKLCICGAIWKPICGVDGKTYGNACKARCSQVAVKHRGKCKANVIKCPIGTVKKVTKLKCKKAPCPTKVQCVKAQVAKKPTKRKDCVCPAVWNPMCGSDGKTYSNPCGLSCAGVGMKHPGECRKKKPKPPKAPKPPKTKKPKKACAKGYVAVYEKVKCKKAPCKPLLRCKRKGKCPPAFAWVIGKDGKGFCKLRALIK